MASYFPFHELGGAFLARDLHELRLITSEQCDQIFGALGITAPSHCASAILALASADPMGPLELADRLRCSHQLIDQRLKLLEQRAIVRRRRSSRDRRKSLIVLTAKGKAEAVKIERALPLIDAAIKDLFAELGADIGKLAIAAHAALLRVPLTDRAGLAMAVAQSDASRQRRRS